MSLIFVALMFSAQAAAEAPQAAAAPVATTAAVPEKKKPKLICKRTDDADSGSHMSRRTCLTAEQWNGQHVSTSRSGVSISGEAMQGH